MSPEVCLAFLRGVSLTIASLTHPSAVVLDVGSVNIDDSFKEIAKEQIDRLRSEYLSLPEHMGSFFKEHLTHLSTERVASEISKGEFQTIKNCFGGPASVPTALFTVRGLPDYLRVRISQYVDHLRDY
jgi:hypothetical protein